MSAIAICPASAQTTGSTTNINLGSVVASGTSSLITPDATGTQAQAVKQQKLAPNLIFVQPTSIMRQLPDTNVAETLQHVPGVSAQSDSGFGRFLVIRGLSEDLNATQYAGIDLPATNTNASPTGGGRGVALDFLPAGVIGGTEVIASLTPSMSATGLGGVINLLPPALPDNGKPLLNITTAGGVSAMQGHGQFEASIMAGDHFAVPGMKSFANNKPFSGIFSYAYLNTSPGISDAEESYTNPTVAGTPAELNKLQLRRYNNNRITQGYSGELDFDPNSQVHLFVRGLHSQDTESIQKNELYLQNLDATATDNNGNTIGTVTNNGNDNFTATGANLRKYYENSGERVGLNFFEGGGYFTLGHFLTIDFHSAYAEGYDQFTHDYVSNFSSNNQNLTINYDTANTARRSYSIQTATGTAYNPADPSNYTFSNLTNYPQHSEDKVFDNGVSGSVPTFIGSGSGTFEAGFDATLRSRAALYDAASLTPSNGAFSLASVTSGKSSQSDYGNLYPVGPNLNYNQFFATPYTLSTNTTSNILSYNHASENIFAGFGQETIQFDKLIILAGLRVEATNALYTAYGATTDASGNTVVNATPTIRGETYTNIFPSAQLTYNFTDKLQTRFAYSTGVARPGFQQIIPAVSFTAAGGQGGRDLVSVGNPNLKPQTGTSYDFALAYYPGPGDVLEADAFIKDFKNYIVSRAINTSTTTTQTYENINGASAQGIVLEAIHNFRALPAPFDGLGINTNITIVNATANIIQGQGKSILPQTYPLTYNATETYNKYDFHADLAESYTSRNLFAVGSGPSTNVYTAPIFRLDLNLGYDLTPHLQLFLQGKNLTNSVLEFTQSASTAYPVQREYYGQDFLVGVHYQM